MVEANFTNLAIRASLLSIDFDNMDLYRFFVSEAKGAMSQSAAIRCSNLTVFKSKELLSNGIKRRTIDGFTLKSRARAQNTSMRINRLLSITYPAKFEASSHDRRRWA